MTMHLITTKERSWTKKEIRNILQACTTSYIIISVSTLKPGNVGNPAIYICIIIGIWNRAIKRENGTSIYMIYYVEIHIIEIHIIIEFVKIKFK